MRFIVILVLSVMLTACGLSLVSISKFRHAPSQEFYTSLDKSRLDQEFVQEDLLLTLEVEGLGEDYYRSWFKIFSESSLIGRVEIISIKLDYNSDISLLDSHDWKFSQNGPYYLATSYFSIPTVEPETEEFKILIEYKKKDSGEIKSVEFEIERYQYKDIAWPT